MISTMNQVIWDAISLLNVILFCAAIMFSFKISSILTSIIQRLGIKKEHIRTIRITVAGFIILGALFFCGMVAYLDTLQHHLQQLDEDLRRLNLTIGTTR